MRIWQVDSFTDRLFGGNPAGVCLLDQPREDAWLQSLAAEMNVSETAFVTPQADGFGLRWFTPSVEVDLCGHATLASAHVLWQDGLLGRDQPARFHTRSGLLTAEWCEGRVTMEFPADPPSPCEPPEGLYASLGIGMAQCYRGRFDYMVVVDGCDSVRALNPDFLALQRVDTRGVIVTARCNAVNEVAMRFFAPACGINEDPVTGSAFCCIVPYWRDLLGVDTLTVRQLSRRGGVADLRQVGERVVITGSAVTVFRGELNV